MHLQFLLDFLLVAMPSIEEPSINFCYINTMDDAFEVPLFSSNVIGSVKDNKDIRKINHWLVLLREDVTAVYLKPFILCQVVSFDCVGAFYSWKTWLNNNTFVIKIFHQMCSGIAVCQIVEPTTAVLFLIFFGHQWASSKGIWVNGWNWLNSHGFEVWRVWQCRKPIIHK